MPRRRAGVPYASGQASQAVRFLDTRGQPVLGVVLCSRCSTKRMFSQLTEDGNIIGFMVCLPEISPGCWDTRDPMRESAPPPDDLTLPFVRPDVNIAIEPDGLPPLEPPPQDR